MEKFLSLIDHYNNIVNGIVWGTPMLILLIGVGIFYTIRIKGFQITHAKEVYENTVKGIFGGSKGKKNKNVLSQFQALSTALASTIGTGNIAGVSTAIVVGGPGSIFWMWICAIFGMATHFAEIVLGIYFRNYEEGKGYNGGPMYYLENGIGKQMKLKHLGKILAIFFALFTFIASYGIGNMTQINSISEALRTNFNVPPLVCGIVFAIIAALIIFGGISRIGKVAERIVPFMALFYIIVGIIMVVLNIKNVPAVFVSIFTGAFNTQAIAGGALGVIMKRAISYGFKRGAFSNEAGLGTSVIAHSASEVKEPVKQGLWGIFEVFFDTLIVCTFTSLIILSSSLKAPTIEEVMEDLPMEETIVCIDDSNADENGEVMLVDNNIYRMPIKLDASNNAKTYLYEPNDGKDYIQIYSCGNTYYVEKLDDNDLTSDSCFFGNVLKVKANPIYHTNKEILIGDDDNPVIDSIHIENINGVSLVTLAVSNKLSNWAGKILAIAVTLFAFTTILGWSYYGSQTIGYIFGKISIYIYKVFYILFIIVGSVMSLNLVWNITDTFNALMAIPNLIGLLLLSGTVIKIVKNYYARQKGKKVAPMISFHKMK